ncbi:hypothetical protein F5890DRAFT_1554188 [Lentinula detonsa]|uniref:XRRM domain-containing protein n=1 Tax=Lentinula detonsa TaxID=2804962 RepID=A0AA38URQ4_9AGAR|nr:hypothetical protein F5890DRAFT_1554188 [Lentinula detonsa]
MPFTFIPRNVGKKTQTLISIPTSAAASHLNSKGKMPAVDSLPRNPSLPASVPASRTDENSMPAEEIAILVALSLTEYTLWANGDLRRRIEQTTESESGFLPLRYILKHSPLMQDQRHYPQLKILSESAIVKALRKYTEDEVEVRMVLSGPAWSNWGSSSANTDQGMYEVRSRTTANQVSEGAEAYTRGFWAKRTVYIENIPPTYRTMHGVFQFVQNTYPSGNPKIQGISFPQHHLDIDTESTSLPLSSKSNSRPRCKGFAFVVFSSLNEVEHFCMMWDWKRSRSESFQVEMEPSVLASTFKIPSNAEVIADAQKHGFRALLKTKWDALKDEYLAWRQHLLEQVLAEQDNQVEVALDHEWEEAEDDEDSHSIQSDVSSTTSSDISASLTPLSPYPPNCLVFIRNIHIGTNKTTLRKLFVKALTSERAERVTQPQDVSQTQYIDYVDYTKGMDTCHVRFSSPSQASALQSYFTSHHIVQDMALDDTGIHTKAQEARIEVEVVRGKKEDIYWEKVPIKVRQEAVRKVLSLANAASCYSSSALFCGSSESTLLTNTEPTSNSVLHPASTSLSFLPTSQSDPHLPPYPLNCLLFIRNVHSGTNKTTLRTFFANVLLQPGESSDTGNGVKLGSQSAIDYVDYTKGTDSCHLRLASPSNARFLVEYFTKRSVAQTAPLDDDGSILTRGGGNEGTSSQRHIIVELVQGTREKVYWEKVPLKVRQEAVRKAASDVPEPFVTSFPLAYSEPLSMASKTLPKLSRKREFASASNMDQDNSGSPLSDSASNIADRKRRKKR